MSQGGLGFPTSARRGRGFTLIEVLVVVAIIALLVAILLPSLAKVRKQTRRTLCSSNLHQIALALVTYRETYKEFPQQAMINIDSTGRGEAFGLMTTDTHRQLARFLRTGFKDSANKDEHRAGELFYCPEVTDQDRRGDELGSGWIDQTADPYLHITYAYYGRLNDARNDPAECNSLFNKDNMATCDPTTDIPRARKRYVRKDSDARHVLMGDMVMFWGGGDGMKGRWRINHGPWYRPYVEGQRPKFDGANIAYGDGHLEWTKAAQYPQNLREGAPKDEYVKTATLVRDAAPPDLLWWK